MKPNMPSDQKVAEGGSTCAVLGAGNFETMIEPLSKLFVENKVVVFKPNPVNETVIIPVFRNVFQDIIRVKN
jgi:hypothetical protein